MLVHDKTLTLGYDNERYSGTACMKMRPSAQTIGMSLGFQRVSNTSWLFWLLCNKGWQSNFAIAFDLAKSCCAK